MQVMALLLALSLVMAFTISNVSALTLAEAKKQLAERDAARKALSEKISHPINQTKTFKSNIIILSLSDSCLRLVKSNLKNDCLTIQDLSYFDNTNQKYFGKFINDNGFFHRGKPLLKNPEIIYMYYNKTIIVCADCPVNANTQYRNIIVEPPNFTYKLEKDKTIVNNTRYEYHDRYVKDCNTARISSDIRLLDDTIDYMKSGCKTTNFHEKVTITKPYSKLSYDGREAQYQAWLAEAKKIAKTNCIKSLEC